MGQSKRWGIGVIVSVVVLATQAFGAVELAKVNGRALTARDLDGALGGLNEGQRKNLLADANARRQVLLNVIDQELLAQEAEKQKLDQDQDAKDAFAIFKKQYLANRLLGKNLNSKLTDAAAKKYYEAHKPEFSTDLVRVMHILLADEASAKAMLKKASEPNADFQELAEKNSKDPSAKNNRGDIGFIPRDRMVPEFTEAAFGAELNKIVGPVKTAFGYHIIKVVERKLGKTLGFEEVESRVRNALQRDLMQTYVSTLKKGAKIEINEANLQKPL